MDSLEPHTVATASRPRRTRVPAAQRREEILTTSARLFQQWGYTGIGIDDIGAEIGISGPAIYRHFSGKEALLGEIGTRFLGSMVATSESTIAECGTGEDTLAPLVTAAVDLALDRPAELTVCLRYLWHLNPERLADSMVPWNRLREIWAVAVAAARPGIQQDDASIYLRSACGLLLGASRSAAKIPRPRLVELTAQMVMQLSEVQLETEAGDAEGAAVTGRWERASRREQILDTAIGLFRERGFRGVSMAEIADAIGLTAGASYRHFESKEDILATAIHRTGERVSFGLTDALSRATSAQDALDRLLRSYIDICVENKDLVAVSLSEVHHVPEVREQRRQRTRLFDEEWTHCLATTRDELSLNEATALVHAITGMIIESSRSRIVSRRPHLADDLYRLAHGVLTKP